MEEFANSYMNINKTKDLSEPLIINSTKLVQLN